MFGLKLFDTVYLATLVELPCIIEAMKTLDFNNFFKSQDAS
jgi:TATA-binding protein-associated factor Taf7